MTTQSIFFRIPAHHFFVFLCAGFIMSACGSGMEEGQQATEEEVEKAMEALVEIEEEVDTDIETSDVDIPEEVIEQQQANYEQEKERFQEKLKASSLTKFVDDPDRLLFHVDSIIESLSEDCDQKAQMESYLVTLTQDPMAIRYSGIPEYATRLENSINKAVDFIDSCTDP